MKKNSGDLDAVGDGRAARWERHRSERRSELLGLARKAIHHLGPLASMDDIAAHAKTSKPVYYRYFDDKEGLRQALGEVVITEFRAQVISAGRAQEHEAGALHAMVTAYLQLAERSPNIYFFVTTAPTDALTTPPGSTPGSSRVLGDFFDEITGLMAERLAGHLGQQSAADLPAVSLWPRAAVGMVRSAGEIWLRQPAGDRSPSLDELADALCGWLTHGIATPQPGA